MKTIREKDSGVFESTKENTEEKVILANLRFYKRLYKIILDARKEVLEELADYSCSHSPQVCLCCSNLEIWRQDELKKIQQSNKWVKQ